MEIQPNRIRAATIPSYYYFDRNIQNSIVHKVHFGLQIISCISYVIISIVVWNNRVPDVQVPLPPRPRALARLFRITPITHTHTQCTYTPLAKTWFDRSDGDAVRTANGNGHGGLIGLGLFLTWSPPPPAWPDSCSRRLARPLIRCSHSSRACLRALSSAAAYWHLRVWSVQRRLNPVYCWSRVVFLLVIFQQ